MRVAFEGELRGIKWSPSLADVAGAHADGDSDGHQSRQVFGMANCELTAVFK